MKVSIQFIDIRRYEMRRNRNLGLILLAVYLILVGISSLGLFTFAGMETIAAVCALAAGILILVNR